jgi:hypothetical protein
MRNIQRNCFSINWVMDLSPRSFPQQMRQSSVPELPQIYLENSPVLRPPCCNHVSLSAAGGSLRRGAFVQDSRVECRPGRTRRTQCAKSLTYQGPVGEHHEEQRSEDSKRKLNSRALLVFLPIDMLTVLEDSSKSYLSSQIGMF